MPENGDPWLFHITGTMNQRLSQVMAMEGACFVMIATQILTEKSKERTRLGQWGYAKAPGGGFSMIYGPDGSALCEPIGDGKEGILYVDADLSLKAMCKQNLDIVGHYARPDLLSLQVTTKVGTHVSLKE